MTYDIDDVGTPIDFSSYSAKTRRWTRVSIECYNRNCRCGGCWAEEFFRQSRETSPEDVSGSYTCQCKKVVLALVREHGAPTQEQIEWAEEEARKEQRNNDFTGRY